MNEVFVAAVAVGGLTAIPLLSWGAYWRSRYHRAKMEVYQEFADTFSGMTAHYSPNERRRLDSQRQFMRLALVDPRVRDGLADALEEAERHWHNRSLPSDPPRDWKIERTA